MTPDTPGFWEAFWFLFGGGLMTGVLVMALLGWLFWPRAVPAEPQAEQVRPEPAVADLETQPLPSIQVWPFADYLTYEPQVHGACVFCGGTVQKRGASLQ